MDRDRIVEVTKKVGMPVAGVGGSALLLFGLWSAFRQPASADSTATSTPVKRPLHGLGFTPTEQSQQITSQVDQILAQVSEANYIKTGTDPDLCAPGGLLALMNSNTLFGEQLRRDGVVGVTELDAMSYKQLAGYYTSLGMDGSKFNIDEQVMYYRNGDNLARANITMVDGQGNEESGQLSKDEQWKAFIAQIRTNAGVVNVAEAARCKCGQKLAPPTKETATPTPTETPTGVPTETPTETPTSVAPTSTATQAPSPTETERPTITPQVRPTEAPTLTATVPPTEAPTETQRPTITPQLPPETSTPIATATSISTNTPPPTEVPTGTPNPTQTEAPRPTITPQVRPTGTPQNSVLYWSLRTASEIGRYLWQA